MNNIKKQLSVGVMLGVLASTVTWAQSAPPVPPPPMPKLSDQAEEPVGTPVLPVLPGTSAKPPTDSVAVERPAEREFSYGRSDISVLFLPAQIEQMKEVLEAYESVNRDIKAAEFTAAAVEKPAQIVEEIKEPADYPVFYLSSIAYEKPNDWSIWVSGYKITAHKNNTDIEVLSVSRDSVTFAWKPEYAEAIRRRRATETLAPTDQVRNKLAVTQRIAQDESTGLITFTLRQNQSFAVGYFSIFEGFMESPKLNPIIVGGEETTNATPLITDAPMDPSGTPAPGAMDPATMDPNAPPSPGGPLPPGAINEPNAINDPNAPMDPGAISPVTGAPMRPPGTPLESQPGTPVPPVPAPPQ